MGDALGRGLEVLLFFFLGFATNRGLLVPFPCFGLTFSSLRFRDIRVIWKRKLASIFPKSILANSHRFSQEFTVAIFFSSNSSNEINPRRCVSSDQKIFDFVYTLNCNAAHKGKVIAIFLISRHFQTLVPRN